MPTIVEVAKRAGVSIATVSYVIRSTRRVSPSVEERVREAIRELNYVPNEIARSLKVRQTRMLGMVVPDITNPFFPEVIRGAEDAALHRGYFLVTANTDEQLARERRIISALRSYRVDGILLASAPGNDVSHIRSVLDAGVPVVCIDRPVNSVKTDAVLLDNVRGSRECVHHLIEAGHRRIAIITGDLKTNTAKERLRGYEEALQGAGRTVEPKLRLEGNFREESGYRLTKKLLSGRLKVTALYTCNGVMALGALRALEELGVRCPQEIALATFDDLMLDRPFHPHLTAVVQPGFEMGSLASTKLIDRIEGRSIAATSTVRVAPKLIVRESTANYPWAEKRVVKARA